MTSEKLMNLKKSELVELALIQQRASKENETRFLKEIEKFEVLKRDLNVIENKVIKLPDPEKKFKWVWLITNFDKIVEIIKLIIVLFKKKK